METIKTNKCYKLSKLKLNSIKYRHNCIIENTSFIKNINHFLLVQ